MKTKCSSSILRYSRILQLFLWLSGSMLLIDLAGAATYYIDFENGNDNAAGTSPGTAWKHVPGTYTSTSSGYITTTFGGGVIKAYTALVPPGTIFKLKSGTKHTSATGGRVDITPDFYRSGTASSPIIIQRDLTWGTNNQIVLDCTGITIPQYSAFFQIKQKYITVDGMTPKGIKIQNSPRLGMQIYDSGTNGSVLRNLEVYNSTSANIMVWSKDNDTPTYISDVRIENVEAHKTSTEDDTAANIYVNFGNGVIVSNCIGYDAAMGADGIHFGSTRNSYILNCTVHDNGEQGIDLSREGGSYKYRDDSYNILVRDCVGYNNYKMNFDSNSGVHDVYWVRCVGYRTTIQATGDGNFCIYQGPGGPNYFINCTSTRGFDRGFAFSWFSDSSLQPVGKYVVNLLNCISVSEGSYALYNDSPLNGRTQVVAAVNCNFNSVYYGDRVTAVSDMKTNYNYSQINSGAGRWAGSGCKAIDPMLVANATVFAGADLRLREGSPMIDAGKAPFTVASSGSGSSISLTPAIAGCRADMIFRPGDTLSIGPAKGTVQSVTSSSVTLTASVNYTAGQLVWFETYGNGVDIGAYEYGISTPVKFRVSP